MKKTPILTAGPKRSKNEVRYVSEAVRYGWNFHHSDYIYRFEEAFAKYLGVKHALTMPTGTSALHLALVLFGVGPGDEVIVPDMTYVACANVVHYCGATPVLVDIDKKTWSIDPNKLEQAITPKTKAIMSVHLYGNMADMRRIMSIARAHGVYVLEDACEGLGCTLHGKPAGSMGDAAAFSFQGAKLLAIGEGGMFVTDNDEWDKHARSLVDHGVDFSRQFQHTEIGFMYPMSNIQAALGLARLEEMDELVTRKRRIFSWYADRLADCPGISLNPQRTALDSSYWMSSIVLDSDRTVFRDKIRASLRESGIDTRPFFYPISSFGFYGKRLDTPVSSQISLSGINLPSGVMLKESTVNYVAHTVGKILREIHP